MKKFTFLMLMMLVGQMGFAQNWSMTTQLGENASKAQLSLDGTRLVTTIQGNMMGGPGEFRVYDWQNNNWVVDTFMVLNDFQGTDGAGNAVALSANKEVVAIGVDGYDGAMGGTADTGLVRVYHIQNGDWIQKGSDIVGNNDFTGFGSAVSLSADGQLLAVGADRGTGDDRGYIAVYEFQNGDWSQLGGLIYGSEAFESFGSDIKISADGQTLAAAGYWGSNGGVVRMYEISGGNITQLGSDITGENTNDDAGTSVSMSADARTVAIGAPDNDGTGTDAGHVRVYQYSNNAWTQLGADIDALAAGDKMGSTVALSADGERLAVTSPQHAQPLGSKGYIGIYDWQGSSWVRVDSFAEAAQVFGNVMTMDSAGTKVIANSDFFLYTFEHSPTTSVTNKANLLVDYTIVNPIRTQLVVNFEDLGTYSISIVDLQGRTILQTQLNNSNRLELNTANWPAGVYAIQVRTEDGQLMTKKVVKQ